MGRRALGERGAGREATGWLTGGAGLQRLGWGKRGVTGGPRRTDGASALGKGEDWAVRAVRGSRLGQRAGPMREKEKGRVGLLLGWVLVVGFAFYFSFSISYSSPF